MLIVPVTEVRYRQLINRVGKENMAVRISSTALRVDSLNAEITSVQQLMRLLQVQRATSL